MENTTIRINGMSCGHCVAAVRRALESLEGVTVDSVSVGEASVRYEPGTVTPVQIANAIRDEGYEPTSL